MTGLRCFHADSDVEEVVAAVRSDGGCVLTGLLDSAFLESLRGELEPWVRVTPAGRDEFTGRLTARTGALVARSPLCRQVVMHPRVMEVANAFLSPWTNRIQLHLTQVIRIMPGQASQPLHRDRMAWGGYIPREIEPQFNTIWP